MRESIALLLLLFAQQVHAGQTPPSADDSCLKGLSDLAGTNSSRLTKLARPVLEGRAHSEMEDARSFLAQQAPKFLDSQSPTYGPDLLAFAESLHQRLQSCKSGLACQTYQKALANVVQFFRRPHNASFWSFGNFARLKYVLDSARINFEDRNPLPLDGNRVSGMQNMFGPSILLYDRKYPLQNPNGTVATPNNIGAMVRAKLSREAATKLADSLKQSMDTLADSVTELLNRKAWGEKEDLDAEKILQLLSSGSLLAGTGVGINRASGPIDFSYESNGSFSRVLNKTEDLLSARTLESLDNAFKDGELTVQYINAAKTRLSPEEKRKVWKVNLLVGIEEYLHVVQSLRGYAGLKSTDCNVSQWARSIQGLPTEIDHEADVYAYFLEKFGPLDPVFFSTYRSRYAVPRPE